MFLIFLYFALFIVVSFASRVFVNPGARKLFQLVLCFILLFGIFGFRDISVLNDTSTYYGFYYRNSLYTSYRNDSIFTFNILERFEWGYQVLAHFLVKYVSTNPYTIIIISSLIVTIGDLWFISKHSRDVAMVCFFFLLSNIFFMHYCIIRQSFALIIFYGAFGYLERGKTLRYCLLILVASLFHSSAYILLLLPLLMKLRVNKRNVIIILVSSAIIGLLIFKILSLLGMHDNPYYKFAIQRESISLVGLIELGIMAAVLTIMLWVHKLSGTRHIDKPLFWICVLAMSVCIIAPTFYGIARVNEFLWPFIMVQLLRYITPAYMKPSPAETTGDIATTDIIVDGDKPHRRGRLAQKVGVMVIVAIFAGKMIGVNAFRPEWMHVVPYQFYDFGKRYHYYNLYPQEE